MIAVFATTRWYAALPNSMANAECVRRPLRSFSRSQQYAGGLPSPMTNAAWSSALLCSSSFLAGAVNAIAGGGTLLTFPSLLSLISPVAANATSTMALLPRVACRGPGLSQRAV